MRWWHFGALKFSVAFAMLLIAKLVPEVLSLEWYWYAILFGVCYAVMAVGFFKPVKTGH